MKTGVYQIRNTVNGHIYIGSSEKSLSGRWSHHVGRLSKHQHQNRYLQNAWDKYGCDNFVFEILLYCDSEDCLIFEQMALDEIHTTYNIRTIASNNTGVKWSLEAREKIRGRNHYMFGKKHSWITCQKISRSKRGVKKSKEFCQHRSKLMTGMNHPQRRLDEDDVQEIRLALVNGESQRSLAKQYRVSRGAIQGIHSGKNWRHI